MGDLFVGMPVRSYAEALPWYERLLEAAPSFHPHDTEAVWQVHEHGYVYIIENAERAGHGLALLFVDDLDARLERLRDQQLTPSATETYEGGVRKVTFRDPDGNEVSFGSAPA